MTRDWPNLFLLGVPKAGSTTVFDLLAESPEVHCPRIKESGFFAAENQWQRGRPHAEKTFDFETDRPYSLEATPWNFYLEAALERIRSTTTDDRKAIVVLRDPIDRAVSMYHDQHGKGLERRSIDEAFQDDLNADWSWRPTDLDTELRQSYLRCGVYADRLQALEAYFDATVVIFFEDLLGDPSGVIAQLADELGLRLPSVMPAANRQSRELVPISRVSASLAARLPSGIREAIGSSAVTPYLRSALTKAINVVSRPASAGQRSTPDSEIVAEARDRFALDAAHLSDWAGRTLPWSSMAPGAD